MAAPVGATVAVVDEGLLDLTDFATPDPWKHFYAKEMLSVQTSDLYDDVLDFVKGEISQRYTVGGAFDLARRKRNAPDQGKRFHPVALFSGPVRIEAGKSAKVTFRMPHYMGSVRVMAIVLSNEAYASLEKAVPVKAPLIVLPTVPRVIGPDEEFDLPVTVFATNDNIRDARLKLSIDKLLEVIGRDELNLNFDSPGDTIVYFRVRAEKAVGVANIAIESSSGTHSSKEQISLSVRPANPLISVSTDTLLTGREPLSIEIPKVGLDGTNTSRLTVSVSPEINLSYRMAYLIRYPYGCLEQTVSSVFPQLYLRDLIALNPVERAEIDDNINAAIRRLRRFQQEDGWFSFWPGLSREYIYSWSHAYAGHFLLVARQKGYHVPDDMLNRWLQVTRNTVRRWPDKDWRYRVQAYDLFILALAEKSDRGMMNWLRENRMDKLDTLGGWLLAAAYHLSGKPETAKILLEKLNTEVGEYREFGMTYGSRMRDRAMILYLLDIMGNDLEATKLLNDLAKRAKNRSYYWNTQETAMLLLAYGKHIEKHGTPQVPEKVEMKLGSGKTQSLKFTKGRFVTDLTGHEDETLQLSAKTESPLYVEICSDGIPLEHDIKAGNYGLSLDIEWLNEDGARINPDSLPQGVSFWARFTVDKSYEEDIEELALSAVFPSGWEIDNPRLTEGSRPPWMDNLKLGNEDYVDIRDDRVNWFFDLPYRGRFGNRRGDGYDYLVRLTATYAGSYYLPPVSLEAMYDPQYFARSEGRWVKVLRAE